MESRMARVGIVGIGYAGIATGIALAKKGHRVVFADIDPVKVEAVEAGRSPMYEAGLEAAIRGLRRRGVLRAAEETERAVRGSDFVFLCVGTPSREDGSPNTDHLDDAASAVGETLSNRKRTIVVVKSTVLPGTTEARVIPALEKRSGLGADQFGVCVNPEFFREGRALEDTMHPTHVVVGERDRRSGTALLRLLSPKCPTLRTSIRIAEAVKYATNAFLATKVTFANELANLATRLELDVDEVLRGMTLDPRISPHHLQPGPGFGGSCLPKDLRALVSFSQHTGYEPELWRAVLAVNDRQHLEIVRLLEEELGGLEGKRIALLGLAFKAGTDDVRESKALGIARELLSRGASVVGYDPIAAANFSRAVPEVRVIPSVEDSLRGAAACVIQADWPEFRRLGPKDFASMARPVVVDSRRTWPSSRVPKGIIYRRLG